MNVWSYLVQKCFLVLLCLKGAALFLVLQHIGLYLS